MRLYQLILIVGLFFCSTANSLGVGDLQMLRLVTTTEFFPLHPWYPIGHPQQRLLALCHASLLKISPFEQLEPDILKGIPTVDRNFRWENSQRILLKMEIAANARWPSQEPIEAKDIEASWKVGQRLGVEPYTTIERIFLVPARPRHIAFLLRPDAHPSVLWQLSHFRVVPQSILLPSGESIKVDEKTFASYPANKSLYGGLFSVQEWQQGESVVFNKNPARPNEAKLSRVKVILEPDLHVVRAGLSDGKWDLFLGPSRAENLETNILSTGVEGFAAVHSKPSFLLERVEFSLTHWALKDKRLRRALAAIIDRSQLKTKLELSENYMTPYYTPWNLRPTVIHNAKSAEEFSHMLTSAGWRRKKDGWYKGAKRLNLNLDVPAKDPKRTKLAQELAAQWQKVGVTVNVRPIPRKKFHTQVQKRSFKEMLLYAAPQISVLESPRGLLTLIARSEEDAHQTWLAPNYFAEYTKHLQQLQSLQPGVPLFFYPSYSISTRQVELRGFYNRLNLSSTYFSAGWNMNKKT